MPTDWGTAIKHSHPKTQLPLERQIWSSGMLKVCGRTIFGRTIFS